MYHGIINVYKEKGFTSHDVVAKLRGILQQKKIGHTGTLDPDAAGVLPVCLGKGTKLCGMLTDKDKVYETVLLLGTETDTQDITGQVLSERSVKMDVETVTRAIAGFVGGYSQIPPMYSALKVNGRKLCDLARAGVEVERKPRQVTIHSIDILEVNLPRVKMRVHCSKGTYIRTLCHDIGGKLGCGGCMESLVRTKVSCFCIEDARTLDEIKELADRNCLDSYILKIEDFFEGLQKVVVRKDYSQRIYNGNPFDYSQITGVETPLKQDEEVRVFDENNQFVGIYKYDRKNKEFRNVKMFLASGICSHSDGGEVK